MVGKENGLALDRNLESANLTWATVFWKLGRTPAGIEEADIRGFVEADGGRRSRWIMAEWPLSRQLVANGAQREEGDSIALLRAHREPDLSRISMECEVAVREAACDDPPL